MKYLISYGLLITTLFPMVSHSQITPRESNILSTPITWQAIQKKNVVKQNVDYSCGSASLATILTYFYDQPTTEAQVIKVNRPSFIGDRLS